MNPLKKYIDEFEGDVPLTYHFIDTKKSKKQNINHTSCGQIHTNYFSVNIPSFTEAVNYNSCLNRKMAIDVNGNIKNCPALNISYGNINDTSISEVIKNPELKKYWDIKKDDINICKDCEFRYACTDCRAYIENPKDIHSKPLKCGYNPYTNEWSEWSKNPLKTKAIKYYGL